ncbi:MAG: helix-turn-helix domain-containing protein [Anaerolineae bacterium]
MSNFLEDSSPGKGDPATQKKSLTALDLLDLPPLLAKITAKIIRRRKMRLRRLAEEFGQTPQETERILKRLVEKGYLEQIDIGGEIWVQANFKRQAPQKPTSDVLSALDSLFKKPGAGTSDK